MAWLIQLRETLSERYTLIHILVNCLKYSKLLPNAVDTFLESGLLGESALNELNIIYD